MHPELLYLEWRGRTVILTAYSTGMCLALLTIVSVSWILAQRRGLPRWRILVAVTLTAVAFPVGSRLCYWATGASWQSPNFEALLNPRFAGFYLPGGVVTGIGTGLVVCWLVQINWWRLADAMLPGLALGGAVMRVGCFLNGCCLGKETTMPWGVTFPVGSPAHLRQASRSVDVLFSGPGPVHPTQLYELAASVATAVFAAWVLRRRWTDGAAAMAATACFMSLRWAVHCFRATTPLGGSWSFHALHAVAIVVAVGLFWERYRAESKPDNVV